MHKDKPSVTFPPVPLGLISDLLPKNRHQPLLRDVEANITKLFLLGRHHNILWDRKNPTLFLVELSLKLARELYPAPRKRGAKQKWNDMIKGALVVEVERLIDPNREGHGVRWATAQLARQAPWKSFSRSASGRPELLRTLYYKSRKSDWAKTLQQEFLQAPAAWPAKLKELVTNFN